MEPLHYKRWPKNLPHNFTVPKTPLYYNLEVTARRYPDKVSISYYGTRYTFSDIKSEVDALAGYLQEKCGVRKGDRVMLYMQNCPQFVIAYYAILRADAVIVPTNPMNLTEELRHYIADAGTSVAICGSELSENLKPLMGRDGLEKVIVTAYGNYTTETQDYDLPEFLLNTQIDLETPDFVTWSEALTSGCHPGPHESIYDDLAAIIYTSGTTGLPKGCMHTHFTLMSTTLWLSYWQRVLSEDVLLAVVPFFHVTGMQVLMNAPLYSGAEIVLMTRWDRELALKMIETHKVSNWTGIPTMVIDLFASPNLREDSLKNLNAIGGGGAAMPEPVARRLKELTGLTFIEGYGLTETAAPTHSCHNSCSKPQCLGIPICNTESLIIDPQTFEPLGPNETGEIVSRGPQVFKGYWNNPKATEESMITIGDKAFFRTGDLGYYDDEGFFFLVDRLKRMINASGFKVWPAEIESFMYGHADIQEACIISAADPHRGETVKAVVVLREEAKGKVTEQEIIDWCKERMSAYKYPRIVEFVEELPKSGSGKVQWRLLQEKENQA